MKMKMISKEIINNKTVITTESKGFFRKKIRQFEATREYPKGYWNWLELPNRKIIYGILTFQLDAWNRL